MLNELKKDIYKEISVNFQGKDFKIKPCLSFSEKIAFIKGVVDGCFLLVDNKEEYKPLNQELFFVISILNYYTDIPLTKKENETENSIDGISVYDSVMLSGLFNIIYNHIPKQEILFLKSGIRKEISARKDRINFKYQEENNVVSLLKYYLEMVVNKLPSSKELNKIINNISTQIEKLVK